MNVKCWRLTLGFLGFFASAAYGLDKEPEAVVAPMIFASGFESGKIVNGEGWKVEGNLARVTSASEPAREGNFAMKTYLSRSNSAVSYRTELRPLVADPKYNTEYWYGFSTYTPGPFVADNIWETIAQWHDIPDSNESYRNAVLALRVLGDEYVWTSRWDDKAITPQDSSGSFQYGGTNLFKAGSVSSSVNRWNDWVVHVSWRWVNDNGGFLRIWKNGELVVDHRGPNAFNDARGPYFKMGLYKGWRDRTTPEGVVSERTYYHDSFRMAGPGASYEDVAPGNKTIVPKPPAELLVD